MDVSKLPSEMGKLAGVEVCCYRFAHIQGSAWPVLMPWFVF